MTLAALQPCYLTGQMSEAQAHAHARENDLFGAWLRRLSQSRRR
ncbi:hypothetical protein [Sphingobium soli]|nr:hypothetical protein [Sphingobium soli]